MICPLLLLIELIESDRIYSYAGGVGSLTLITRCQAIRILHCENTGRKTGERDETDVTKSLPYRLRWHLPR